MASNIATSETLVRALAGYGSSLGERFDLLGDTRYNCQEAAMTCGRETLP